MNTPIRCQQCGKLRTTESRDPCKCQDQPKASTGGKGVMSGPLFIGLMCIPPVLVLVTFAILLFYSMAHLATH